MPCDLDRARHVQLPALLVAGAIAQTLERDGELHLIAELGELSLRFPHVVGSKIGALARLRWRARESTAQHRARFREHAITLNAEGVHGEYERLATVAIRAEKQLHVVVSRNPVAIGEYGADAAWCRERPNAHMQFGRGIPYQHLGTVLRCHSIGREKLREPRQQRGVGPRRFIEPAVDHNRRLASRRGHRELPASTVKNRANVMRTEGGAVRRCEGTGGRQSQYWRLRRRRQWLCDLHQKSE